MQLSVLVATSAEVAATRSRKAKTAALARFLQALQFEEIPIAIGLLSGEIRQGRIGVGYAAAFSVSAGPAPEPQLSLAEVDRVFDEIPATTGSGSQERRARLLGDLFARATAAEQEFCRRILTGEVRQGALSGLMVDAVAEAFAVPANLVRRALMLRADLGAVGQIAASGGIEGLSRVGLEVLSPLQPMLASPARSIEEAVTGAVSVEWKLDGARIQVHRHGDQVRVFTRNQNDITLRMPEVEAVARHLPVETVILDGEAMALRADGTPQPFQETMSRFGTEERAFAEVPLYPFFFDVLHLNGEDLIDLPLAARLQWLDRVTPGEHRVARIATSEVTVAARFSAEALGAGHEGVMVKTLESPYEAGRRGKSWRKVKPVHTYDLVVLGVEWGHGRRSGYLSNIHLGARDPATGEFVMVGKTFKGMTDEILRWQTERFPQLEIRQDRSTMYLRPEQVVEVAIDGVQASPRYPGGIALRFARVKRYRFDKGPDEADTIETLRALLRE
ncbi:MAG TPA: ATP-dependent DNA ligase [Acidimicrobiia bacterium]|nr:ATP-dependent DNA ligase [Acidimicrobiia bacterium]